MRRGKNMLQDLSESELEEIKKEWLSPFITSTEFKKKYKIGYAACANIFGKRGYFRPKQNREEYERKRSKNFDEKIEKRFKIIQEKFGISRNKVIGLLNTYTFTELYRAESLDSIKDLIIFNK